MNALSDSISFTECTDSRWDCVVIGAGCAGAVAARELARSDVRVLLVDKAQFPRYKVCGCCIGRPVQSALARIGLGSLLEREGAVATRKFDVRAGRQHATIPLPEYMVLSRERLDAALVREAVKSGASFLGGTHASLDTVQDESRTVLLRNGDNVCRVQASIVIIADGLGSRLLRATDDFDSPHSEYARIGMGAISLAAPTDYRPGTIYMACAKAGYVGACRREDGRLVLAAACDAAHIKMCGGLSHAAAQILENSNYAAIPDIHEISWKGTPALTRTATTLAARRAFVLGDAAGYVEPFTGEGMKWAMESAIALAPIARDASVQYDARYEQDWIAARRRIVTQRTAVCRMLAASLRYPALVKTALRVLSVAPVAAAPFVRSLNAPPPAQKEVVL
ncbi:MAG: FAD-dependent monooxygenase [Candidatus Hydrogenedentes bacterium]|nr:FAD-dependent monooxygenase [Candidatus Hydrogenedentota bacterium]